MQGFVNKGLVDEKTVCLTNIYSKKSYICNSSVVSKMLKTGPLLFPLDLGLRT